MVIACLLLQVSLFAQGAVTSYVQETEPVSPPINATWFQPSTGTLKIVTSTSPLTWGAVTGAAGAADWPDITNKPAAITALSGTNTGDQTITLTGDVTGSGTGSFATTIGSAKVTEAMQVLADNTTQDVSTTKHGYVPKAPNDTTKFLRGDATWQVPAGGSNYRTKVALGGDVTDSAGAATYADCTGLSFAVTSGTRYNFYALIWYTSAATTTGSKWAINGPATTNMAYTSRYTLTATSVTTNFVTAYDTPSAANATSLTAGNIAIVEGTILPSANGTVIVRFATEVDTSAVICKAGSTLEYWTP